MQIFSRLPKQRKKFNNIGSKRFFFFLVETSKILMNKLSADGFSDLGQVKSKVPSMVRGSHPGWICFVIASRISLERLLSIRRQLSSGPG